MKVSVPVLMVSVPIFLGLTGGVLAQSNREAPALPGGKQLPSERTIGRIEPVFEFYDATPTGVTVSADGRI
jgi:hypothetical protein